jgi:hypothetical protein
MNELERIEAMRAAGTLSDAEADRLIGVLRDLGTVPAATDRAPEPDPAANAPAPATAAAPAAPATPAAPAAPAVPAPPTPLAVPTTPAAPATPGAATRGAAIPGAGTRDADRTAREEARDELRRVAREAREQARSAARSAGAEAADAVRIATDKVRESVERLRETWSAPDVGGPEAGAAAAPEPLAIAPQGTRWLRIELPAGDLDVRAADVDAPTLDGDEDGRVRLETTADGARLYTDPQRGLLGRFTPGDARVRIPRAWGIDLDVKAGDLDVRDVPFVAGRILAGDVEVRGARGLDLTCLAGDVSIAVAPTEGRHRLVVRAGDLSVRLLPGSDVAVDGRVSVGDASARGLQRERRGLGAVVHGRVGAGTAQLSIELGAGDLEVRAEERPTEREG